MNKAIVGKNSIKFSKKNGQSTSIENKGKQK